MAHEVKLYMDPSCPHCRQEKRFLDEHGIQYEARDVTSDEQAQAELAKMGAAGVPVAVIDGETVIGFNPQRLEQLLT